MYKRGRHVFQMASSQEIAKGEQLTLTRSDLTLQEQESLADLVQQNG